MPFYRLARFLSVQFANAEIENQDVFGSHTIAFLIVRVIFI